MCLFPPWDAGAPGQAVVQGLESLRIHYTGPMRPCIVYSLRLAAGLALFTACGGDPEPAIPSPQTSGESEGQAESETSDAPELDLDEEPSETAGCAKVDLLFVIDNSHSMGSNQGALVESFPEFIDDLYATLDSTDSYHVGVVTTDAYVFNTPECQSHGALVARTGGESSSDAACGPYSGGTYMTEAEDLASSFACAAQVGVDGSIDERPIQAALEALGPTHAQGCNAGFLREDALLVLVIITDEEDDHTSLFGEAQGSPGEPNDWFAALEAIVGIEQNAVVLTICGGHPDDQCGFPVGALAEPAPRLRAFTTSFTHAYLGDICAGNFGPFFAEAVAVVDLACENFTPIP